MEDSTKIDLGPAQALRAGLFADASHLRQLARRGFTDERATAAIADEPGRFD